LKPFVASGAFLPPTDDGERHRLAVPSAGVTEPPRPSPALHAPYSNGADLVLTPTTKGEVTQSGR
jgi:hypothetical protein